MKKICVLLISLLVFLSLTGCGGGGGDAKTEDSSNPAKSEASDKAEEAAPSIEEQYNTIRENFIQIKTDISNGEISAENIEKITGISPTVIKDGVEEYNNIEYQYKFDYGFDYEAYIEFSSSKSTKSTYPDPTIRLELECPDEFFENSDLDLSGLTQAQFKSELEEGLKVSAVNTYAGGEGFPNQYSRSYDGTFEVESIVWADGKGNYIDASLAGTGELADHRLSLVWYNLNQ
jgi:hypothetical protein